MNTDSKCDAIEAMFPAPKLAALGLQHVLVMYAGAIAVPLIIGSALNLSKDQIAMLISADLFCCGIVTLIQCLGVWNVGARLPIMMGIGFTAVPPIIATGTDPDLGMPGVLGAVIASGVFTLLAAPLFQPLGSLLPGGGDRNGDAGHRLVADAGRSKLGGGRTAHDKRPRRAHSQSGLR